MSLNPTNRSEDGIKRSLLLEAQVMVLEGASRHDTKLTESTLQRL